MKSRGLGDSIRKFSKLTGIETLVELVAKAVNIEDCGCNKREVWLNKQFPYKINKNGGSKH
jgi:hypothetical protein